MSTWLPASPAVLPPEKAFLLISIYCQLSSFQVVHSNIHCKTETSLKPSSLPVSPQNKEDGPLMREGFLNNYKLLEKTQKKV